MAQLPNVKQLFSISKESDTVTLLQQIVSKWNNKFDPEMLQLLRDTAVFTHLATVMYENYNEWSKKFPKWITDLMFVAFEYRSYDVFPLEQVSGLSIAYRKYIASGCFGVMKSFRLFAAQSHAQQILLEDNVIYNILKKEIKQDVVIWYFQNCTSGFDPWKRKILEDTEFVLVLRRLDNRDAWNLLFSVAVHPDAKVLMPKEVVHAAGKVKTVTTTNIYALLCSDNDLLSYSLDTLYIESQCKAVERILTTGMAVQDGVPRRLLSILRPIANISATDAYKDILGEKSIKYLLDIVCNTLMEVPDIQQDLSQSRSVAARTLWNLAYIRSNCLRIREGTGLERLKNTNAATEDPELKSNIQGILHMCTYELQHKYTQASVPAYAPIYPLMRTYTDPNLYQQTPIPVNNVEVISPETVQPQTTASPELQVNGDPGTGNKHVMISYNWDNQPIVKRIAQSLKDRGYNIWIDIEQMSGSTLEAMAKAIEHSEVVLICMSQKYKDSPNCRLEGNYCVTKKVAFVPLMMQKGYAPDGWLGIALGSKLWYDFSNENDWDSKIAGLTKAIGEHIKIPTPRSPSDAVTEPPKLTDTKETKDTQVLTHTEWDMLEWMHSSNIEEPESLYEILRKHKINKLALLELKYLLSDTQQSNFTKFSNFQGICKELGIGEIGIVLQLAAAIRKL